jgi:hypothetical protein
MQLSSLLLSIDSFIAALALSAAVSRRHILPLIVLFGLCDGLGTALGPALGLQLPSAGLLSPAFLTLWGTLMLLGFPVAGSVARAPGWPYLLPPLLAIDNMLVSGSEPDALAALSSSLMAALGFACGAAAWRRGESVFPAAERLAGTSLLAAGCLLLLIGA